MPTSDDSSDSGPLSAADRKQLTELLTQTTWDIHGLLGIFSAMAIAPRDVGFAEWMLVVAPRPKGLDAETTRLFLHDNAARVFACGA